MKKKYPYLDKEKRINALRKEKNMTLKTLANKLEFSEIQTSNIMNGKQAYNLETVHKLAKIFDTRYQYFTYDSDFKNGNEIIENFHETMEKREFIIKALLETYNYKVIKLKYYKYHEYYYSESAYNKLVQKDDHISVIASPIYLVETPDHEKKYISLHDLEQLTKDFISLFNNRLITKNHMVVFKDIPPQNE